MDPRFEKALDKLKKHLFSIHSIEDHKLHNEEVYRPYPSGIVALKYTFQPDFILRIEHDYGKKFIVIMDSSTSTGASYTALSTELHWDQLPTEVYKFIMDKRAERPYLKLND